ncbi:ClbS/DfsB family four-helix bundle protein [Parasphingopyxis sp.]|uniref:ClbS/DfsB family four-helix bundle protein n=1 Tax=Parasphingopyxis sp. TaxID=1920299 RepID=UPI00260387C9|nr:ClbS/DfsB family four-helix bundle protein [Parasphingopyxis sp.]
MPAATDREALLAVHDKEYAKLIKTLDRIDAQTALLAAPDDDWRIKDIVAHRAHWIGLFFTWYDGGKAGEAVETPAPGYKWNKLKSYNAMVKDTYSGLDWVEVRRTLGTREKKLRDFIAAQDDAKLYTQHLYPWLNKWTLGRWAEASGASAFRSATKVIRSILRKAEH